MTRLAAAALTAALAGCSAMRPADRPPTVKGWGEVSARGVAPDAPAAAPDPAEVKAFEATLRALLVKNLPDPIVRSAAGWGHQKDGVVGVKFHRDGPRLRSENVIGPKNDGTWRRVAVRARNPQSLAVGITEAAFPKPGRATFTAMIGLDCNIKFEQQLWRAGARLYSGETRGRCRAALLLKCEVTSRAEAKPGQFLPDLVFRMRATEAQLFYQDVVVEHTAGVGGDAAKVLGGALLDAVKRAKPDLERDLLAKANAAVVAAADTKDVRLSVGGLFGGRGK